MCGTTMVKDWKNKNSIKDEQEKKAVSQGSRLKLIFIFENYKN